MMMATRAGAATPAAPAETEIIGVGRKRQRRLLRQRREWTAEESSFFTGDAGATRTDADATSSSDIIMNNPNIYIVLKPLRGTDEKQNEGYRYGYETDKDEGAYSPEGNAFLQPPAAMEQLVQLTPPRGDPWGSSGSGSGSGSSSSSSGSIQVAPAMGESGATAGSAGAGADTATVFLLEYAAALFLSLVVWVAYLTLPRGVRRVYCRAGRKIYKKSVRVMTQQKQRQQQQQHQQQRQKHGYEHVRDGAPHQRMIPPQTARATGMHHRHSQQYSKMQQLSAASKMAKEDHFVSQAENWLFPELHEDWRSSNDHEEDTEGNSGTTTTSSSMTGGDGYDVSGAGTGAGAGAGHAPGRAPISTRHISSTRTDSYSVQDSVLQATEAHRRRGLLRSMSSGRYPSSSAVLSNSSSGGGGGTADPSYPRGYDERYHTHQRGGADDKVALDYLGQSSSSLLSSAAAPASLFTSSSSAAAASTTTTNSASTAATLYAPHPALWAIRKTHPSALPDRARVVECRGRLERQGVRLTAHGMQCAPKRVWLHYEPTTLQFTWQTEVPRTQDLLQKNHPQRHSRSPSPQRPPPGGTADTTSLSSNSSSFVRGPLHRLAAVDISYIDVGKHTGALRKVPHVPASQCFSLLTAQGSLDLQCYSQLERNVLVCCMSAILDQVHVLVTTTTTTSNHQHSSAYRPHHHNWRDLYRREAAVDPSTVSSSSSNSNSINGDEVVQAGAEEYYNEDGTDVADTANGTFIEEYGTDTDVDVDVDLDDSSEMLQTTTTTTTTTTTPTELDTDLPTYRYQTSSGPHRRQDVHQQPEQQQQQDTSSSDVYSSGVSSGISTLNNRQGLLSSAVNQRFLEV